MGQTLMEKVQQGRGDDDDERYDNTCCPVYQEPKDARRWCREVFRGMEHVHLRLNVGSKHGIIRDLKLTNVGIQSGQDGRMHAKIFDMGSFTLQAAAHGGFSFGYPPASPGFVSPEVIREWAFDFKTDMYSFGALVWVVLTGGFTSTCEPPHAPQRESYDGYGYSVHYDDYKLLHQVI